VVKINSATLRTEMLEAIELLEKQVTLKQQRFESPGWLEHAPIISRTSSSAEIIDQSEDSKGSSAAYSLT